MRHTGTDSKDESHNVLLISFVGQTRILLLNGEEVEETEINGIDGVNQTLYAANLMNGHVLQVTAEGVRVVASGVKLNCSPCSA